MRPKVLEISWHETQAVYSCDFQPLPVAQLKKLLPVAAAAAVAAPAVDEEEKRDREGRERSSSSASATPSASASGSAALKHNSSNTPGPETPTKTTVKKEDAKPSMASNAGSSSSTPVRQYRLATAGGDSKVRLWMVHPNIPTASLNAHAAITGQELAPHPPRVEYLATLSKHTAAVNVVRFSPSGQTLASAGDDGNVILWVPSDRPIHSFGESGDEVPDKEHWRLQRMLQVTTKHIYDLAWSPDGEFIIAGSTDNTATIWRASSGECVFALREHTHNVQGVSWDPLNEFIATQSADRSVHVSTFSQRNGIPDVHPVSRANKMEIRHSRTPSIPSSSRPTVIRRNSNASETGSVITTASEFTELGHGHGTGHALSGVPLTPGTSVPSTPQAAAPAMNPPTSTKPGSRRSSFSGSQAAASPALSAIAQHGRGRSPSPMPPLPAIRAPPTSGQAIMQRLYGEEGVTRFFRRLSFSPDGSLLMTPAGQIEDQLYKGSPMLLTRSSSQDGTDPHNNSIPRPKNVDAGKPTVYIYSRANLARSPIAHLPGHKTAAVAIRFSPIFYDLRSGSSNAPQAEPKHVTLDRTTEGPVHVSLSMPPPPPPAQAKDKKEDAGAAAAAAAATATADKPLGTVFALPYRLLYAVACQDSVMLYDTQQAGPIAIFRGLHYAGFTDIAWSPDGQALMLSSSDGYCSIVVFDLAELGTVHPTQQHHRQLAAIAQSHSYSSHGHSHALSHHRDSVSSATHRDSISLPASATTVRDSLSHASTPLPHSPALSSNLRHSSPAPARSDREGSTSSSILGPSQSATLPLFTPILGSSTPSFNYAASTASTEPVLPTPAEEVEGFSFGGGGGGAPSKCSSDATGPATPDAARTGLGLGGSSSDDLKRPAPPTAADEATGGPGGAKKKRRVVLTHLGEGDA